MIRIIIENHTAKRAVKAVRKFKDIFTAGSNGGIDDEYYINEIIGIEELPYSEWAKDAD
mgnify:FL=1|jgi:hypothetical protein